jgi:multidrug resistance efflux pump
VSEPPPAPAPPQPGKGARVGAIVVLVLIFVSLLWYFVADRLTPYTSQARIQAFVVRSRPRCRGLVLKVYVKNNDEVQKGQPCSTSIRRPYRIAAEKSHSDFETVRRSINGANSTVVAARAGVQAAVATEVYARQDATRLEQIYKEDPGAISLRRVQNAQATLLKATAGVKAAEADLRKAEEAAGEKGERNAQLLSARAAVEKAELDLKRTVVIAPAGGMVTDLRTDVGRYATTGSPAMTLIATHDLWIYADMTENNLGNIDPGDEAAIVLDIMPGHVLKGRVRSVGGGGRFRQGGTARKPCPRSRTAAIGCGRRNASRWPSKSILPSASICSGCALADRPRSWSTRETMF